MKLSPGDPMCYNFRFIYNSLFLFLLVCFFSCSEQNDSISPVNTPVDINPTENPLLGGGTDVESFRIKVVGLDGLPARGTIVKAFPIDFNPLTQKDTAQSVQTDSMGVLVMKKHFISSPSNLVFQDSSSGQAKIFRNIRLDSLPQQISLEPTKSLRVFFRVQGTYSQADSGQVFLPGTNLIFNCKGKPEGTLISALPTNLGKTVFLSSRGWKHEANLALIADTTRVYVSDFSLNIMP